MHRQFCESRSRVVAIWDVGINECFKLYVNRGDGGFGVLHLQIIPDFLSCLHGGILVGNMVVHPQDEVANSLVITIIPMLNGFGVFIFSGRCRTFISNGESETLCLKVGMHFGGPGEVVGTSESGNGDAVIGGGHCVK